MSSRHARPSGTGSSSRPTRPAFWRRPRPLPKSKDLRETWWKVGDQGSTGSCVGWATADALLRWHFVKAGRIKNTETLSKRFIWMASKETDEFTSSPTTFIENAGTA